MRMKYQQTKQRLFELLQAGHKVTIHWDCGGDEAFVYPSIDGEALKGTYRPGDFAHEVSWLVAEALELPSAGEFSMTGDGEFFLEGRSVGLSYQSEAEVYEDELDDEFYAGFTDEQLAEMGLERPAPKDDAEPAADESSEEEEPRSEQDEEMSQEYSGRRILFELPD
jgi:hypothetical protein